MEVETAVNLDIRPSTTADFGSVLPMLRQLWPSKKLDPEAMQAVFTKCLASEDWRLLCADVDGRVAGFCSILFRESLWQEGSVAYVEILVVGDDLRGQGIGGAMMDRAMQEARSRGCRAIELDSALHRDRAHAFYERLGFKKDGYAFWREI